MLKDFFKLIDSKYKEMLEYRRWLHAHPELSFEEKNTSDYIYNFYKNKDVKIEKSKVNYGLKITIDSGNPGKTIALRADFDALPITEDTSLEFASKTPGIMHSCGHDAHTAYLMALADGLIEIKDKLKGKIVIIHQPAEEMPPGGAIQMIKEGVLGGVDSIIGCHVMSSMDFGKIYYHIGPTQQARAKFEILVQGKGGHGSSPHETNDAILIASHLVINLQSIKARRLNPFEPGSISVGSFDGKGQFNIIKDSVRLEGDVRCMSDETSLLIEKEIENICKGLEEMYQCRIELQYKRDYPVLINDKRLTQFVVKSLNASEIPLVEKIEDCGPLNPSEDFSYYTREIPATFFYIGAKPLDRKAFPHHHPKFDIEEKSMLIAAKAMGSICINYLLDDSAE